MCAFCALTVIGGLTGCGAGQSAAPSGFRADEAWGHLLRQCESGPRVPGTVAHAHTRDWLRDTLAVRAPRVEVEEFRAQAGSGEFLTGWNIVASWPGEDPPLLLGAHWDCRAGADRDPDETKWNDPVPGANDGASGVAVLLEIARLLQEHPPRRQVIVALFDLEDQGSYDAPETFCLGSEALARRLPRPRGAEAIVVDMVGAADMTLRREAFSARMAPDLTERLWTMAAANGLAAFRAETGGELTDDHVPFLRRGWLAVDIVDVRYPYWHTTADTPDKCSPESLGQVGGLLARLIASGG